MIRPGCRHDPLCHDRVGGRMACFIDAAGPAAIAAAPAWRVPTLLLYAGDDHLVIGSDYGHPGDVDDSIFVQTKLRERADVPAEKSQKILSDNAHRLFGSV